VGLSQRTAGSLDLLERMALAEVDLPKALGALLDSPNLSEAVVLSTCARTEVYAHVERFHGAVDDVRSFLADLGGETLDALDPHLYCHFEDAAAEHLFCVAAGVDSPVLGESEVLSQVRSAWERAREEGAAGPVLSELFRHAVEAGKRARSETGIARGITSVSQAAVALAAHHLGESANGATILVVGAGEMGEGMLAALASSPWAGRVMVSNRTWKKAVDLAKAVGGSPVDLGDLARALESADLVLTSAGASTVILEASDLQPVLERRRGRSLLVVDVAVPRNVEPAVGDLDGVTLLDMDDLSRFAESGLSGRRRELARVAAIVSEEVERYTASATAREVAPIVTALRRRAEEVRARELERFRGRLGSLGPREAEAVEALTSGIIGKLLHEPTVRLKEAAGSPRGERLAEALRSLFDL
jgi:glutamyl-tRNA reductase